MSLTIQITVGDLVLRANLHDTETARRVWEALPLEADGSLWGDEIYFEIPVEMDEEDPQEVVEVGDLGYWPTGQAFCLFWGPTPASEGDEIRPASAVNVFGRIVEDARLLGTATTTHVRVERLEG
ncbi:MAG: cyclophilin-like fold protein [bacterium]|nr:cyclophilin-like fold protein [bacterium]